MIVRGRRGQLVGTLKLCIYQNVNAVFPCKWSMGLTSWWPAARTSHVEFAWGSETGPRCCYSRDSSLRRIWHADTPERGSVRQSNADIPATYTMSAIRTLANPVTACFSTSLSPRAAFHRFLHALSASIRRLDLSRDPSKTLNRLKQHRFTLANTLPRAFMLLCASYSLYIMTTPPFPLKLGIPIAYVAAVILPITSQFVWPATPIFAWLITFFSARFIPSGRRPEIHVALLPALESVLYGANISDLQTRYTNAFLDVVAWLPYGVLHFTLPFVVAVILWSLGPRGAVQFWGLAFGWMNLLGVVCQLLFPAAAPCKYLFYCIAQTHILNIPSRVRNHSRSYPRRLLHGRVSRRSHAYRPRLPLFRLYQRIRFRSSCFWCLPLPPFRMCRHGSALPFPFLPISQGSVLGLRRCPLVGDHVPLPPLPHRPRRWSLSERLGVLLVHA